MYRLDLCRYQCCVLTTKQETTRAPKPQRLGVTLLEVLVSLILISTILLVCVTASANLFRDNAQTRTTIRAHELASMILDETSVLNFRDTDANVVWGIEPDESVNDRTTFDDIDDYARYSISPPTYRDGSAIEGYDDWTVTVEVAPAVSNATGISISGAPDSPLRVVTVICQSPVQTNSGEPMFCRQSILVSDVPTNVTADVSYETYRQLDWNFTDGRDIKVIAPLRNQPVPTY
ncbi:MAG: hypothetical protein HKN47_23245 [Pirellulaceae bacterium]|nr:hypothetical protein [Pirellulaceae bacterium]